MPFTLASQRPTHYVLDSAGALFVTATLPNVAGSPNTTANLQIGDLCWNSSLPGTMECTLATIGAATWQAINSGGAPTLQVAYNGGNTIVTAPGTPVVIDTWSIEDGGITTSVDGTILGSGAGVDLTVRTTDGTISIDANGVGQQVFIDADERVSITAANTDVDISANVNVDILAVTGGISLNSVVGLLNGTAGAIQYDTTGTAQYNSVGTTVVQTTGANQDLTLQTANGAVNVTGAGANGDVIVQASVSGQFSAQTTMTVQGNSGVTAQTINGPMALTAAGALGTLVAHADQAMTLNSDAILTVSGEGGTIVNTTNAGAILSLTTTDGAITIDANGAGRDVTVTADDAINLNATGDLVGTAGGAAFINASGNATFGSSGGGPNSVTIQQTNTGTITVTTTSGDIIVDANGVGADLTMTADAVGSLTAASVDITSGTTDVDITSTTSTDINAGTSFNAVAGTSALVQSTTTATVDAGTDATVQSADDVFLRPGSDFYEERVQFNTDTGAGPSECARVRQTGDLITVDRARVYDPCMNVFNADHFQISNIAAGAGTQTPVAAQGGQIEVETNGGTSGDGTEVESTIQWMTRSGDAYFRTNISTDNVGGGDRQIIAGITESSINNNTATTSLSWFDFDPPTYGNANWRSVTADGAGGVTTKDTGVAAVANTAQTLEIQEGPEEVHFYINNVLVTSHVAGADNIPASSDLRLMTVGAIEVGNGASIKFRIGLLDGSCHLTAP